jgi:hypothetical protein
MLGGVRQRLRDAVVRGSLDRFRQPLFNGSTAVARPDATPATSSRSTSSSAPMCDSAARNRKANEINRCCIPSCRSRSMRRRASFDAATMRRREAANSRRIRVGDRRPHQRGEVRKALLGVGRKALRRDHHDRPPQLAVHTDRAADDGPNSQLVDDARQVTRDRRPARLAVRRSARSEHLGRGQHVGASASDACVLCTDWLRVESPHGRLSSSGLSGPRRDVDVPISTPLRSTVTGPSSLTTITVIVGSSKLNCRPEVWRIPR